MSVPKAITPPSIQINKPLLDVFEHSAWYVGMVDVLIPLPTPVMVRPTINWANGVDPALQVTWMMTPKIMTAPPSIIARLLPRKSPKVRMNMAPKRQPRNALSF